MYETQHGLIIIFGTTNNSFLFIRHLFLGQKTARCTRRSVDYLCIYVEKCLPETRLYDRINVNVTHRHTTIIISSCIKNSLLRLQFFFRCVCEMKSALIVPSTYNTPESINNNIVFLRGLFVHVGVLVCDCVYMLIIYSSMDI